MSQQQYVASLHCLLKCWFSKIHNLLCCLFSFQACNLKAVCSHEVCGWDFWHALQFSNQGQLFAFSCGLQAQWPGVLAVPPSISSCSPLAFGGWLWTRINMIRRLLIKHSLWPRVHTRFTCENVSYKPNQWCATAHWRTSKSTRVERKHNYGREVIFSCWIYFAAKSIFLCFQTGLLKRRGLFFFTVKQSTMYTGLYSVKWIKKMNKRDEDKSVLYKRRKNETG